MNSRSLMTGVPTRYSGGHGFDSYRGLRFFFFSFFSTVLPRYAVFNYFISEGNNLLVTIIYNGYLKQSLIIVFPFASIQPLQVFVVVNATHVCRYLRTFYSISTQDLSCRRINPKFIYSYRWSSISSHLVWQLPLMYQYPYSFLCVPFSVSPTVTWKTVIFQQLEIVTQPFFASTLFQSYTRLQCSVKHRKS